MARILWLGFAHMPQSGDYDKPSCVWESSVLTLLAILKQHSGVCSRREQCWLTRALSSLHYSPMFFADSVDIIWALVTLAFRNHVAEPNREKRKKSKPEYRSISVRLLQTTQHFIVGFCESSEGGHIHDDAHIASTFHKGNSPSSLYPTQNWYHNGLATFCRKYRKWQTPLVP